MTERPAAPPPPTLVNKRALPRQATSAVAFAEEGFPADDPLLDFLPFIHPCPRRNSITPDVQRAFVHHLAASGIVKSAALHVGKSVEALYKLRERPGAEGFRAAWDAALAWGTERLEDCALERALAEGAHNPRANSMLCFVIRHRSHHMVDARMVKPGHWLYDRIRYELTGEWGEEEDPDLK